MGQEFGHWLGGSSAVKVSAGLCSHLDLGVPPPGSCGCWQNSVLSNYRAEALDS